MTTQTVIACPGFVSSRRSEPRPPVAPFSSGDHSPPSPTTTPPEASTSSLMPPPHTPPIVVEVQARLGRGNFKCRPQPDGEMSLAYASLFYGRTKNRPPQRRDDYVLLKL